jgi:hypothetical protein
MSSEPKRDIEEILECDEVIDEAVRSAVRDALRFHKALGNPIAEWRDGRVVWIQPEDIDPDASESDPGV